MFDSRSFRVPVLDSDWVKISTLPPTSCVTVGKLFNLSEILGFFFNRKMEIIIAVVEESSSED